MTPERFWLAVVLFHAAVLAASWRLTRGWRDHERCRCATVPWLGARGTCATDGSRAAARAHRADRRLPAGRARSADRGPGRKRPSSPDGPYRLRRATGGLRHQRGRGPPVSPGLRGHAGPMPRERNRPRDPVRRWHSRDHRAFPASWPRARSGLAGVVDRSGSEGRPADLHLPRAGLRRRVAEAGRPGPRRPHPRWPGHDSVLRPSPNGHPPPAPLRRRPPRLSRHPPFTSHAAWAWRAASRSRSDSCAPRRSACSTCAWAAGGGLVSDRAPSCRLLSPRCGGWVRGSSA